jgi:hypothetical protein
MLEVIRTTGGLKMSLRSKPQASAGNRHERFAV